MAPIPPLGKNKTPNYAEQKEIRRLDRTDVELDEKIKSNKRTAQRELGKTSEKLSLKIQDNYEELDGRVKTNASKITATAQEILAEVGCVQQGLEGEIKSLRSGVVLQSDFASMYTQAMNTNGVITSASISTYIKDFQTADGVKQLISVAEIRADKINFDYGLDWTVKHQGEVVFHLDGNGNLNLKGVVNADVLYRKRTDIELRLGTTETIPDSCGDIVSVRLQWTSTSSGGFVILPHASSMENRTLNIYTGVLFQTQGGSAKVEYSTQEGSFFDLGLGLDRSSVKANVGTKLEFYSDGSKWTLLAHLAHAT